MNILVLGGESKTGEALVNHYQKAGHTVLGVGRATLDFAGGWVTPLHSLVVASFGNPLTIDVVVVNVYDNTLDNEDVQERVTSYVWRLFKDQSTTIVVIGCMSQYTSSSKMAKAKARLATQVRAYSTKPSVAKLLFIEPDLLEVSSHRVPHSPYLPNATLARAILEFVNLGQPYLHVSIKGSASHLHQQSRA